MQSKDLQCSSRKTNYQGGLTKLFRLDLPSFEVGIKWDSK